MRPDHPIACVTFEQARSYCGWHGKRLPSEAEWERAARGSDARPFPWGEDEPTCAHANFLGCAGAPSAVGHAPVGASPGGVFDMAGNVAEWVADWMDREYYRWHPTPLNPRGPVRGEQRVVRGGSFEDPAGQADNALHVASRASAPPAVRRPTLGFRCARSVSGR
jgi:serine/threonine-protein kinase